MATMPLRSPTGQPGTPHAWFATAPGRALLDSEDATVADAFDERPGQPWLWLGAVARTQVPEHRGLALAPDGEGWSGPVSCALPLPLPSDTFGTVVLQHVVAAGAGGDALLEETARILVPGGRLWLFALNPLAPYRWRWRGAGLDAAEPLTWRRRLRRVGLQPDAVSRGLGPKWRVDPAPRPQDGPGLRAAYLIRSEKRTLPLTPRRAPQPLRLPQGFAAG